MSGPPGPMPYAAAFLQEQRELLNRERERMGLEIARLTEDMQGWRDHEDAGVDQDMADDATALSEQELDVSLLGSSQGILLEIEDALGRLAAGTYGWDEESDCWIREDRLRVLPWARREVAGQRRLEARIAPERRDEPADGDDIGRRY